MPIVTRDEWNARQRGATRSSHPIGNTLGITAHWEGPHMGGFSHGQCAAKVRGIEAFHRDNRGWADIAYNALVCPHGYVFEGRGPGVKSAANGDGQANDDWYAVCYLGGERDGFTDEGKAGFLEAFGWLTREGDAGPRRNGHRDHKATACPGDEIYRWVQSLPDGATAEPIQEDDMPYSPEELRDVVAAGVAEALNANLWDTYGEDVGKRKLSHILLRTDHGVRLLRGMLAGQADEIARKTAAALGDRTDASAADIARELLRQLTADTEETP